MLWATWRTLMRVVTFRESPEALPYHMGITQTVTFLAVVVQSVFLIASMGPLACVLTLLLMLCWALVLYRVLKYMGKEERFLKMWLAFQGTLLLIPLFGVFVFVIAPPLMVLFAPVFFVWQFGALWYVFQKSLEVHPAKALLLLLFCHMISALAASLVMAVFLGLWGVRL